MLRKLLTLSLKCNRAYPEGQQDEGKELQSEAVRGKKLEEKFELNLIWGTVTEKGCELDEKRVVRPKVSLGGTTIERPLEYIP